MSGRFDEPTQGERDRAARVALGPAASRAKGEQLLAALRDAPRDAAALLRLISEGAELGCVDAKANTPLILACGKLGELHCVAARLVAAGAELDPVNTYGNSALFLACYERRAATAMLLVEAGAALNLVNCYGKSALDYASEKGLHDVAAAIRARGGRTAAELKARR